MVVVGLTYLAYPIRLVRYSRRVAPSQKPFWKCIRVSAAFDPAIYIYPTILPPIVALSLFRGKPTALTTNLILGIAALPPHVLGFNYDNATFSKHWAFSLIPAFLERSSNHPTLPVNTVNQVLMTSRYTGSSSEIWSFLFPLHANIIPLLYSFTTTSLLPAELQLLSVSLINLLVISSSPQSRILACILWLGGLGIIILCAPVIRWGVSLARVPRWRFKRAGRIIQARQTFIRALNEAVRNKRRQKRERQIVESDADDDDENIKPTPRRRLDLPSLKTEVLNALKQNFFPADDDETRSAVEKPSNLSNNDWSYIPPKVDKRRRHTLSNDPTHKVEEVVEKPKRKRGKLIQNSYFLGLTPQQATVRKWAYAAYIYLVMAFLILFPIRSLVSHLSLHGAEPFGWAIGYLAGNLREVRFWIVFSGLDQWINLPPMTASDSLDIGTLGRASYIREVVFGPANTRLLICSYCLGVLAVGMFTVLQLTSIVEVDTRRKVFHGMMVAMLLPTIFIDPLFSSLALVIILAIFIILDLLRASQLPPLSRPIAYFLTPYVDGRDLRGPVVISHIFLLIGCAVPLWLSLAGTQLSGEVPWQGWETRCRDVSMISGVVCVGMGDAAASLIGRRFGRHKWPWSGGKSLEGSVAFVAAVTTGLLFGKVWLTLGQWPDANVSVSWTANVWKAGLAASAASLMEAVLTGGNDNVVVPVVLWIYVRALNL
jgi:dolichol kinase